MAGGRKVEVEVVAVGKDGAVAGLGGIVEALAPPPALNHGVLGQAGTQDFVPAHHLLAVFRDHGQHPAVEVGLQRVLVERLAIRLQHIIGLGKRHDARTAPPLPSVVLIAPDVEVGVGKQGRHLLKKRVEQGVGAFLGGVEGHVGGAPALVHHVGRVAGGQLGVSGLPGNGVAGHVEFRHHPNAPGGGVAQHLTHLGLGVVLPAHLVQAGQGLGFHPKPLIVGQVPVQHVELHGSHAIEVALDDGHGHKVPGRVNQQPPPRKARLVLNIDFGQHEVAPFRLRELFQRGQGP